MTPEEKRAVDALNLIIPILEKYKFSWVITGGFACYVYGVKRPITDIDIDVDTSKDSPEFKSLMNDLRESISQPLEHFVDQNYDNYNFETTINGRVIDICPMKEMNVFDKDKNAFVHFYENGFPSFETKDFFGIKLPILSKELIVKNKEMLVWKRESDLKDIESLS